MKYNIYLLAFILTIGCFRKEPSEVIHKGESIPKFNLLLLDSSTYYTTENIPNNKPVILFYFGAQCPYSRVQMKDIITNMKSFQGVEIVAITTSPLNEIKWFYENYNLKKFRNITIGIDYTNFFKKYYDTRGVPYLAIYGQDKRLKNIFAGLAPVKELIKVAKD